MLRLGSGYLNGCVRDRRLGVEPAATFEEVQDARNYLYEVSTALIGYFIMTLTWVPHDLYGRPLQQSALKSAA